MIVNTVVDSRGSVASIAGTSSTTVTGLGAGAGAGAVVWISPARVTPDSAHARAIANAKRLILSVSPLRFRNASRLARKHDSVNTYSAIDTASRAVSNIGAGKTRLSYSHPTKGLSS